MQVLVYNLKNIKRNTIFRSNQFTVGKANKIRQLLINILNAATFKNIWWFPCKYSYVIDSLPLFYQDLKIITNTLRNLFFVPFIHYIILYQWVKKDSDDSIDCNPEL